MHITFLIIICLHLLACSVADFTGDPNAKTVSKRSSAQVPNGDANGKVKTDPTETFPVDPSSSPSQTSSASPSPTPTQPGSSTIPSPTPSPSRTPDPSTSPSPTPTPFVRNCPPKPEDAISEIKIFTVDDLKNAVMQPRPLAKYTLENDLDLTGVDWSAIRSPDDTEIILLGNNHTIKSLRNSPVFRSMYCSYVQDLTLDSFQFDGVPAGSALAGMATKVSVRNIQVKNFSFRSLTYSDTAVNVGAVFNRAINTDADGVTVTGLSIVVGSSDTNIGGFAAGIHVARFDRNPGATTPITVHLSNITVEGTIVINQHTGQAYGQYGALSGILTSTEVLGPGTIPDNIIMSNLNLRGVTITSPGGMAGGVLGYFRGGNLDLSNVTLPSVTPTSDPNYLGRIGGSRCLDPVIQCPISTRNINELNTLPNFGRSTGW